MTISDDLRELADWLDSTGAEQWNNPEHASGQVQLIDAPLDLFVGGDPQPYEDSLHVHVRFGPFAVVQVCSVEEFNAAKARNLRFDLQDEKEANLDRAEQAL